jgi:predicted dehydrogenase
MNDEVTIPVTRRGFLRTSAAAAAASTLPAWFLEGEAQTAGRQPGPNDRPAIALVGCGGMGRNDAKSAARFGTIVGLCDVDERQLAEAAKGHPGAKTFKDFRKLVERKDVDAVICGTVDHWHTLVSMAAMRAGKDVYCEKPLTLTIDEGRRLVATARETKRLLQTGSQQRSDNFRLACALVRNGRIGKLSSIDVWLPAGPRRGPFSPQPAPRGLDWDRWQGQTPRLGYVRERCHGSFRYWWEYSGGTMTDWGAHHNDIALWGMGLDRSGPVSIEGKPLVEMIPGGFTASSEYEVSYTYANGVTHVCRSTTGDNPGGGVIDPAAQRHGVKFSGDAGWIWVTRGSLLASAPELLTEPLPSGAERLAESTDHMKNFIDSIGSRQPPICDVEIGHRAASVCHLGVMALRLGRKLHWDPAKEVFVGDAEADTWIRREMRKGYGYEFIR